MLTRCCAAGLQQLCVVNSHIVPVALSICTQGCPPSTPSAEPYLLSVSDQRAGLLRRHTGTHTGLPLCLVQVTPSTLLARPTACVFQPPR